VLLAIAIAIVVMVTTVMVVPVAAIASKEPNLHAVQQDTTIATVGDNDALATAFATAAAHVAHWQGTL
jgi:hypothetical protein